MAICAAAGRLPSTVQPDQQCEMSVGGAAKPSLCSAPTLYATSPPICLNELQ